MYSADFTLAGDHAKEVIYRSNKSDFFLQVNKPCANVRLFVPFERDNINEHA